MKFKPSTEWQTSWLQGEIKTTYATLVAIFGEEHSDGDGYKVQAEWNLVFEDGTYATIYDWKEDESYCEDGTGKPKELITEWHIGGTDPAAVERVLEAVAAYLPMSALIDYNIQGA